MTLYMLYRHIFCVVKNIEILLYIDSDIQMSFNTSFHFFTLLSKTKFVQTLL